MRVADHREQRVRLLFAVNHPVGIEDLVAAVFRVGLGKHHQLDVTRIASQALKAIREVVDLIGGQGQAEVFVCRQQRIAPTAEHIDERVRPGFGLNKQAARLFGVFQHRFCHAIVHQGGDFSTLRGRKRCR